MKNLLLILLSFISMVSPSDFLTHEFNEMTQSQKDILERAYNYGKTYDLGYSMAAIAWQESQAGKYLINLQDPSFGVWHNNLNTVIKRLNVPNTKFNRNKIASKLINNESFAASQTVAELKYWKVIYGKLNWMKIWSSYNGGWNGNSNYAIQIKYKIKILKRKLKG